MRIFFLTLGSLRTQGHSESTTDGDGGGHGDASVVNITVTPARGGTTGPSLISGGSDSPNKR